MVRSHHLKIIVLVILITLVLLSMYWFYSNEQPVKKLYIEERQYDERVLGKCLHKAFRHYLIVINFNFNMYSHADLVKEIYVDAFGKVVTCGPKSVYGEKDKNPDIEFDVNKGDFSYYCMVLAIQKYPDFKGYMYGNDDMIINWWTMLEHDFGKIWHGTEIVDFSQPAYSNIVEKRWIWWKSDFGLTACQHFYENMKDYSSTNPDMKKSLHIYLRNGNGLPRCSKGWSDFFYIPKDLSRSFVELGKIAYKNKLYLEIAVHNIILSLVHKDDIVVVDGKYLPDQGLLDYKSDKFWKIYSHQIAFVHPFKFNADNFFLSRQNFKERVLRFVQKLMSC